MKSIRLALGVTATLFGVGLGASSLLTACSRAPEAAAPESKAAPVAGVPGTSGALGEEAEPQTLAEAEALLERSRAELDRLALNVPPPPTVAATPSPAQAPAPAPAAPAAESAPKRAEKATADQASSSASPRDQDGSSGCETACKAFASLDRASEAVCRLDTNGGQRCERARRIRDDARVRIAGCACTK